MNDKTLANDNDDLAVGEFIALARSANVYLELVGERLTVRAVNPNWRMWAPIRHLLDEIGQGRILAHLRGVR